MLPSNVNISSPPRGVTGKFFWGDKVTFHDFFSAFFSHFSPYIYHFPPPLKNFSFFFPFFSFSSNFLIFYLFSLPHFSPISHQKFPGGKSLRELCPPPQVKVAQQRISQYPQNTCGGEKWKYPKASESEESASFIKSIID